MSKNTQSVDHKRKIDLLIISDIHLGTYGCKAKELLNYLKSIEPKQVILNGDIIDIWQFSKRYWPKSHMRVIVQLFRWLSKGIKITYNVGNHDEILRKFEGFNIGSFELQNKLTLELNNRKVWIFHGDVFDLTMQHSRWVTKLGAIGYDFLILINQFANWVSSVLGYGRISLSKRVKDSVKGAVKFINKFEETATNIASENGFDYVICGHIHQPEHKTYLTSNGPVVYLNSGDWIENLTAIEYHQGMWRVYQYNDSDYNKIDRAGPLVSEDLDLLSSKSPKELYGKMLNDMLVIK